tara:strand:- start:461 stop:658 length:198 start_codon:yes stop_codon:yes gene_type:complete
MPVKDIDGGLGFQGFSPRTITGRLPKDTYNSVPMEFGGSNLRLYTTKGQAKVGQSFRPFPVRFKR